MRKMDDENQLRTEELSAKVNRLKHVSVRGDFSCIHIINANHLGQLVEIALSWLLNFNYT